jgi:DNA-binding IclR family transcriptional regulator
MTSASPIRLVTDDAPAGGHPRSGAPGADTTVVDKVRLVLETLAANGAMGLTALSREAGLAKTTVHRLGNELVEWGLVSRVDGKYALGQRLAELGQLVPTRNSLRELGQPFAVDLFTAFRQPVAVSVLQGLDVRCIAKVSGSADERKGWMGVGTRAPAHCTAAGKAILAFSPLEVFNALVARPLPSVTPYTVCAPGQLARQLREVRRNGYSLMRQEIRLGHMAVGVPIIDRRGHVAGALTIELPPRGDQVVEIASAMKVQAVRLAARLG